LMVRRLRPTRLIAIVSGLLALYSLAGVANRFFEAWSEVSKERTDNMALLELCRAGQAAGSAPMRRACLEAHVERASPILFRAITKAVNGAFKDFSETVGSPLKLLVFVLFLISSVTLPVVPWARMLFGHAVDGEAAAPVNGVHYIGFAPQADRRGRVKRRLHGAMKALRLRRSPTIEELEEDDLEPGQRAIVDVAPHVDASRSVQLPVSGWDDISLLSHLAPHEKWD
jgi:hypothetical protein